MFLVLVVDPDPAAPSRWTPQLEAEGFRVITTADAESALLAFEEHLPQMVVVDADLDGLSGIEVCDAIKARTGDVFVPVMLVAPPQADGDKSSVYDAGADEFITKPIDPRELSARLRSMQKIHSIANRHQPQQLVSTYAAGQGGDEEIVKVIADRAAAGRALLFRFSSGEQTAYLATDGLRIIHARIGTRSGRDALREAVCWPAGDYVCIETRLKPALDADLGALIDELLTGIDHWRLFTERLVPAQTTLRLNPLRAAEMERLPLAEADVARAFAEPKTLDAFVRGAPADWLSVARTVAALYYRGILLRAGAAPAAWHGSPLVAPAAVQDGDAQAEELQLEVLSLNAALTKAADESAALKSKLAQATQDAWRETSARESALKMAEARAAELDTELVALKRRYASRLKDLAAKAGGDVMDSVIEQLSRDLQDAHSFAVSVQNAKNLAEKQAAALHEEVGALKYALEEASGTVDWLKQQQQSSVEQGGAKLQALQAEIAALKAELAESGAQRARLQDELQGAKRGAASLAVLDSVRARLGAAENAVAAHQAELREKSGELERLRPLAAESSRLRAELNQMLQSRDDAEWAAKDSKAALERAGTEIEALRSALAERDAASPAAHDPALAAKLTSLQGEVAALRETTQAAEAAAQQLRAELAEANGALGLLGAEADAARGELENAVRRQRETADEAAAHLERVVALEQRIAELESQLVEQTAALEAAALREKRFESDQSIAENSLEEEVSLLKTALTESMVKAEQLQQQRDEAVQGADERARKLEAEVFLLSAQLSQAQTKTESLEAKLAQPQGGDRQTQLENEVAFLKARLEEAAAAEAAARRRLEDELAELKARLNTAALERKQLEQKLAAAADGSKTKDDNDARHAQLTQLRAQNEALEQKLQLAMEGQQRNALLVKAQDQADLVQTLKVSLREKNAELAALRKQLDPSAAGAADRASAETALRQAQAEIEDLKKKVDALRMSLLERDEEIVELTSRLQGGDAAPLDLDAVPD